MQVRPLIGDSGTTIDKTAILVTYKPTHIPVHLVSIKVRSITTSLNPKTSRCAKSPPARLAVSQICLSSYRPTITCNWLAAVEKGTWWGCGNHVPGVIDQIPEGEWCSCEPKVEKEGKSYPPMGPKPEAWLGYEAGGLVWWWQVRQRTWRTGRRGRLTVARSRLTSPAMVSHSIRVH